MMSFGTKGPETCRGFVGNTKSTSSSSSSYTSSVKIKSGSGSAGGIVGAIFGCVCCVTIAIVCKKACGKKESETHLEEVNEKSKPADNKP